MFFGRISLVCRRFFSSPHAENAQQDERNAQELTHIEKHSILEIHLILLGVLNEDSAGENQEEAEAKEETCAHSLGIFLVEIPSYEEEASITDGFVKLARMTG